MLKYSARIQRLAVDISFKSSQTSALSYMRIEHCWGEPCGLTNVYCWEGLEQGVDRNCVQIDILERGEYLACCCGSSLYIC